MIRYELEQGLDALYIGLNNVQNMDEETACRIHNVDRKAEIIEVIQEEIDTYKAALEEISRPSSYELEVAGERYGYDYY